MSFLDSMTSYATDSGTATVTWNQATSTADPSVYNIQWTGLQRSIFDGYEWEEDRDECAPFQVDTKNWAHRIQWGNEHHSWITVTVYMDQTSAGTDWGSPPTTANDFGGTKNFYFYYTWHGGSRETMNFGPICEEQEVAPETFMKWLEKIGHDYAFLRMNHRMQKRMMKDIGHIPPWDPRKIAELEEQRVRFRERLETMLPESREKAKQRMKERWGIEEIPPMTPELLDQIAEKSLEFLKSCLSPEEMKFFDEHGHLKLETSPEIYYIVKVNDSERVERYEKGKLSEKICIHSKWGGLPPLDTVAMKALYIKNAEKEFLKAGNRTKVAPRAH